MNDIRFLCNSLVGIGPRQIEDINTLFKQLSPRARNASVPGLRNVIRHGILVLAVDSRIYGIVGMATLTRAWKPTAHFGTIEDLVIEENYRRQGIGTELLKILLNKAIRFRMDYVELTSHPERVQANRRYLALGAEKRDTNVYRFKV